MKDPHAPSLLPLGRGAGLSMELEFYVNSSQRLLELNRFLVGESDDAMSSTSRSRYLKLVQVPGVDLGYVQVVITSVHRSANNIGVWIDELGALSLAMSRDDTHAVDVGLASAAAAAVQLAAAVHKQVELSGATLLLEGNYTDNAAGDVLVMNVGWAEALGLRGDDKPFRTRLVPWRQVHEFNPEAAVKEFRDRLVSNTLP